MFSDKYKRKIVAVEETSYSKFLKQLLYFPSSQTTLAISFLRYLSNDNIRVRVS